MSDDTTADGVEGAADSRADAASPAKVERLTREYERAGRPFARVTVVRREPPVSANVGDRALVTPEGDLVGWIGGAACAQSVALQEATAVLETGEPRLVGLAPDPDDVDRPGLESYPMTCHSGGTLELFVEPVTPTPRLAVVGDSPVAAALRALAADLTYDVIAVADDADRANADETATSDDPEAVREALGEADYAVVASMGEYDALGVEAALRGEASYVGLVASDDRRDELAAEVGERFGVDPEAVVEGVTTPAGIDVGAKTSEEIAVSILAELVAVRRGAAESVAVDVADATAVGSGEGSERGDPEDAEHHEHDDTAGHLGPGDTADAETVVDPVCGMDVVPGEAAATVEHGGKTYHFCGQGCADAFADDPGEYLEVVADG